MCVTTSHPWLKESNRRGLFCDTLFGMSTAEIIDLIDAEIASLKTARAVIASAPATGKRKSEPPKATAVPVAKPKSKRRMSPEGRARLVAAVKARWAREKKAAPK
jgi:hypothetical protein